MEAAILQVASPMGIPAVCFCCSLDLECLEASPTGDSLRTLISLSPLRLSLSHNSPSISPMVLPWRVALATYLLDFLVRL